ncbi:PRC-barrel domain-containing protein [Natrinema pallidum]|uniref:PRC-barrel domain protein n=2 Tax=Natrinema pallidum TaxID=69527 RepID=L9YLJ3_9EURY|nr:PRC-barrel domain-containing protein [Natrinema pallidum]ELY74511.1 PRC-barrel domain protein [Natrinema pallidum DSM 3751]QCW03875.1 photosystem reaction center subunit H [Natrinema pallidum]
MTTVLASTLSDTPVMGSDGTKIGTVHNITMNVETGELQRLLVTPTTDDVRGFDTNDDGKLVVPASRMNDIDDYLIVDLTSRKSGT